MTLNECLKKMPAGRRFKRRSSETWLKVYDDGTFHPVSSGRGPKKAVALTLEDVLSAEDWHYECIPKQVTLDDLLEDAKNVAKSHPATRLSPVEVAREIATELEMS